MRYLSTAALATVASAIALGLSSPAAAITVVSNPAPSADAEACQNISFTGITELGCAGGYDGNLLQGTVQDPGLAALQALGYPGTGSYLQKLDSLSGNTIDFTTLLTGITYIGIHYGGAGDGAEATSFFKFDAGSGVDSFTFNRGGLSNAVLFQTGGVPEPATWALMLVGFAGMGFALRRGRRPQDQVLQIA